MSEPASPLEPRVLELLRALPTPPAGARDRTRAKLFAAIPGPGGRGPGTGGSSAPATGLTLGKAPLAGIALLVGGAVGALLHSALSRPPLPVVVYVDRPAVAAPNVPAIPPSAASKRALEPPVTASGTLGTRRAPPPLVGPSQLAAERSLLDQARAALVEGDPTRALEHLDKHRRAFLNPMLQLGMSPLQGGIPLLNLLQHLIDRFNQSRHFITIFGGSCSNRIVLLAGHNAHSLRQLSSATRIVPVSG